MTTNSVVNDPLITENQFQSFLNERPRQTEENKTANIFFKTTSSYEEAPLPSAPAFDTVAAIEQPQSYRCLVTKDSPTQKTWVTYWTQTIRTQNPEKDEFKCTRYDWTETWTQKVSSEDNSAQACRIKRSLPVEINSWVEDGKGFEIIQKELNSEASDPMLAYLAQRRPDKYASNTILAETPSFDELEAQLRGYQNSVNPNSSSTPSPSWTNLDPEEEELSEPTSPTPSSKTTKSIFSSVSSAAQGVAHGVFRWVFPKKPTPTPRPIETTIPPTVIVPLPITPPPENTATTEPKAEPEVRQHLPVPLVRKTISWIKPESDSKLGDLVGASDMRTAQKILRSLPLAIQHDLLWHVSTNSVEGSVVVSGVEGPLEGRIHNLFGKQAIGEWALVNHQEENPVLKAYFRGERDNYLSMLPKFVADLSETDKGRFFQFVYEQATASGVKIASWDHKWAENNYDNPSYQHVSGLALERFCHEPSLTAGK